MKNQLRNLCLRLLSLLVVAGCMSGCNVFNSASENGGQRVKVRVAYLEVMDKDKNGEAWDPGGSAATSRPDLFYTVSIDYAIKFESDMIGDTFIARWPEQSRYIEVPADAQLIFTFYDHDKSIGKSGVLHNPDDPIGELSISVTDLTEAARTKKEFAFDRVLKCRFAEPVVK